MSANNVLCRVLLPVIWTVMSVQVGCAGKAFDLSGKRLTVRSGRLELVFVDRALVALTDRKVGVTFGRSGGADANGEDAVGAPTLRQIRPGRAELAYPAGGLDPTDPNSPVGQWVYAFSVEPAADQIVLNVSWRASQETEAGTPDALRSQSTFPGPDTIELAAEGLRPRRVLLGSGAAFLRDEPAVTDTCRRRSNGLHAPVFAALEGGGSCLAVWQDDPAGRGNIALKHDPNADRLGLLGRRELIADQDGQAAYGAWRFGAFDRWEQAAGAYRDHFRTRTGAKPLWDAPVRWTRDIHAVATHIPKTPEDAEAYYGAMRRELDPNRVLLLYWNGDGVIAFGDHRYLVRKVGRPKPEVIDVLRRHGFNWMGYHGYVLLFAPHRLPQRIAELREKQWGVPADYTFQPDYDGKAEDFYDHFRNVAGGYYRSLDEARLWVLHPGAKKVRDYLVRNLGNYCKAHRMQGAYMDILGADEGYHFPAERKIIEGRDYVTGAVLAQEAIHKAHPDLAMMSEYQEPWIIPHVFYTWEGYTHFRLPGSYASIRTRRNHPLRTALWGSFCWTREDNLDPHDAALIGVLPEVDFGDAWSLARAKLFCQNELYNDLPERWDPCAVAYYRGRGQKWFQFRRMPYGDAFVEVTTGGLKVHLGRFRGRTESPIEGPTFIPGWAAYRDGRPIGLDPRRTYRFLPDKPNVTAPVTITDLPAGVYVDAVREQKEFVVVELGRPDGKRAKGKVTLVPARDVAWLATGADSGPREIKAGEGVTLDVDGGLALAFQRVHGTRLEILGWWLHWRGRVHSEGRSERGWVQGGSPYTTKIQVDGNEVEVLRLGVGRYRTCVDRWIDVPAEGASRLAMSWRSESVPAGRLADPPIIRVHVNGAEVLRMPAGTDSAWTDHDVDLAPWAGKIIMVTVSVSAAKPRPVPTGRIRPGVLFRRLAAPAQKGARQGRDVP